MSLEELQQKYEDLKRNIQIGIDQSERGQVAPLDLDATFRRVLAKVAAPAAERNGRKK
jgi:hypothetical protein